MRGTSASPRTLPCVVAALLPALAACPATPYPEQEVDLAPKAAAAASQPSPQPAPLRFSVAAMLSPRGSLDAYSDLFELMGRRLGRRVEFVQRKTYREVNDLLLAGQVDAAIVCTGGYLELERTAPGRVELIAVPVVGGRDTYHSYVLVPAQSTARSLADLEGRRFAFTDELSLTGRAYVIDWIRRHRGDPSDFFGDVQITRSHDRSIEAVARGVVDGACVDSLIFDEMVRTQPALGRAIRRIDTSPPFGSPPVVASSAAPPGLRKAIRDVLLAMQADEEGRRALGAIGFDRFAPVAPSHYAGARAVAGAAR